MYAKILLMAAILSTGQVFAQTATTAKDLPQVKSASKKKKAAAKKVEAAVTTEVKAVKEEVVAAPAEITPTEPTLSAAGKTLKYIKEKFSASYHGEFYAVRKDVDSADKADHDIQDLKIMHNPTLTFKPTKNWQLLATAEFKYTDAAVKGTFVNNYFRSLVSVTRKNLLVEAENGIQLDAGIGRRDFNTSPNAAPTNFGNDRIFTTITKTFNKNSASLLVQYLHNDPRNITAATWKHQLELIPTITLQLTEKFSYLFNDDIGISLPKAGDTERKSSITHEMNLAYLTYQFTDKFSTYYQLKYYHSEDFTNAAKDDYNEHYIGAAYAFTPKATVTIELGSEIFHAHDGKSFLAKKASYPEAALYLDFAI